jgi:elongation factor Ts
MVTTDEIKKLRDATGVSVMQCKKALEEADGDMDKALVILRKQAGAAALKKGDRELGSGTIACYLHGEGSVGAMVELSCETDFVSKNEDFKALAYEIAMQVAASNPEFLKKEEVTDEAMAKAKEVFTKEVADKPADMQEKILEGKLSSYFKDKILLEQSFIKDEGRTISDLISDAVQKFGERTEIRRFVRFSLKD